MTVAHVKILINKKSQRMQLPKCSDTNSHRCGYYVKNFRCFCLKLEFVIKGDENKHKNLVWLFEVAVRQLITHKPYDKPN